MYSSTVSVYNCAGTYWVNCRGVLLYSNNHTNRQLYSQGSLQSGCAELPLSFNRQLTLSPL